MKNHKSNVKVLHLRGMLAMSFPLGANKGLNQQQQPTEYVFVQKKKYMYTQQTRQMEYVSAKDNISQRSG